MKTEFEIAFREINREELINKIENLGWECYLERTLMKRHVFDNPTKENSYIRVRDEGNKITCTYKEIGSWDLTIHSVKELETEIKDYDAMVWMLKQLWMPQKAYQETYRETWKIGDEVEFMIDEWPGLKPFIEIEAESEEIVKKYSQLLGFNYSDGIFWAVDEIYLAELWIPRDIINNLKIITFENPPKK